ncbi:MAG: methionyl-tRNA formyltransferase, partial [Deltaproteobacteria bacterium]|nr:methionyl-tRNA formyltransferase [Deltaproteobacteria bacterium]
MNKPRIVFMGTPDFAVPALQALIDRDEDVIGVVTQPDRPVGRGQKLRVTPVKELAVARGLQVFQPVRVKPSAFVQQLREMQPDLAVVAAYGQLFSQELLNVPRLGFVNVHSSLLPAYRGAAPINRALINGDAETGITIMQLDAGMDTGDMILQEKTAILPDENAAALHDRLAALGAVALGRALDLLQGEGWQPVAQDDSLATSAPMMKKEDGLVNWKRDARQIINQVRGMTPWPGCFTYLHGKLFKIHRALLLQKSTGGTPGEVVGVSGSGIEVAAGSGMLLLAEVQLEGKKKMS